MPGFSIRIVSDTVTPKLVAASALIKNSVSQELDVVGADMEDLARSIVPVDTGFLQSTIYHRVDPAALTLEFGATADYALFVEFGTRRMAAEPYIRPAFDANQQKFIDALTLGVLNAFL